MNYEKLEQLISIPKKSEASKAKIEEYQTEMMALLCEESFSQNAEKYLWGGFSFCGSKPLSLYLGKLSKEERNQVIEKIIKCDSFKKNEKGSAFKIMVSLLGAAIHFISNDREYIAQLIKWCMAKHKKKDGSVSNENIKTIEKYFVVAYKWTSIELPLNTLEINPHILKEFCDYFLSSLKQINNTDLTIKINRISGWLQTGAISSPVSQKQAATPEVSVAVSNIPKQVSNSEVSAVLPNAPKQISNSEVSAVIPNTPKEAPIHPERAESSDLFAVALQMQEFSAKIALLARMQAGERKESAAIKIKISDLREQLCILEDDNKHLRTELENTSKQVSDKERTISELNAEIERLKTVIGVYSEDKQSSLDGQLNAIASKLKTEYTEFKDALELEMTAEIGEILRDQLIRVFKILSKAGIDIESR